jgi:hypothetical protein
MQSSDTTKAGSGCSAASCSARVGCNFIARWISCIRRSLRRNRASIQSCEENRTAEQKMHQYLASRLSSRILLPTDQVPSRKELEGCASVVHLQLKQPPLTEDLPRGYKLMRFVPVSVNGQEVVSYCCKLARFDSLESDFDSEPNSVISVIQYRFRVIFSSDLRGRGCFQSFIASRFNAFPLSNLIYLVRLKISILRPIDI